MAQMLPSLDRAQKLRDQGNITPEQYDQIAKLYTPEAVNQEASQLNQQLSNPLFAPAGQASPQEDLETEAQRRLDARAQGIMNDAEQKRKDSEFLAQEQQRFGAPAPAPQAPAQPLAQNVMTKGVPSNNAAPGSLGNEVTQEQQAMQAQKADPFAPILGEMNHGFALQEQSLQKYIDVGKAKAAEDYAAFQEGERKRNELQITHAVNDVRREDDLKQAELKLNKASEEAGKLAVDQNRLWANKSTGDKILAGIGLFLGAAGAGGNKAVPVIQQAIEQDIAEQKANIGLKREDVKEKRSLYRDMLDKFGNEKLAEKAAEVAAYDDVNFKLKQIGAKYSGPETQAKVLEMMGQVKLKRAEATLGFMSAYQKMNPDGSTDPAYSKISRLPASMQGRAYEELGKVQEWNKLQDSLSTAYGNLKDTGQGGRLPSWIGGSSEEYKAGKARLSGAVVGKVPGIKSDSDFENIVVPMLPTPSETPEAASSKWRNFVEFLNSQAPASPLLDQLKLRPKSMQQIKQESIAQK